MCHRTAWKLQSVRHRTAWSFASHTAAQIILSAFACASGLLRDRLCVGNHAFIDGVTQQQKLRQLRQRHMQSFDFSSSQQTWQRQSRSDLITASASRKCLEFKHVYLTYGPPTLATYWRRDRLHTYVRMHAWLQCVHSIGILPLALLIAVTCACTNSASCKIVFCMSSIYVPESSSICLVYTYTYIHYIQHFRLIIISSASTILAIHRCQAYLTHAHPTCSMFVGNICFSIAAGKCVQYPLLNTALLESERAHVLYVHA